MVIKFIKKIQDKIEKRLSKQVASAVSTLDYKNKRFYFNNLALNCTEEGITKESICDKEVIVTLTSYEKRLHEVYLTIESLMHQTVKPNKIVLWLPDSLNSVDLPVFLKNQQRRGLTIEYCKDIRSYTKLIPSLKKFPESILITVDDDIMYESDMLEKLLRAYKEDPICIYCNRMHEMVLDDKGNLLPYNKWHWCSKSLSKSPVNFATGVGGVLYPPHCFNSEVFNQDVFMEICKYGDDIWFKAMSLLNGYSVRKVATHNENGVDYCTNEDIQDTGLMVQNVDNGRNDSQIKKVFDKYNLYDKLNLK